MMDYNLAKALCTIGVKPFKNPVVEIVEPVPDVAVNGNGIGTTDVEAKGEREKNSGGMCHSIYLYYRFELLADAP